MLEALLTSVWLEVAAASTRYGVAVRVDSRVRSLEATTPDTPSVAGDADITPSAGLQFQDGNTALQVEYSPRLSLREATTAPRLEVQHVGRAALDWRPERGLGLHLTQEAVLGRVDLFTAAPTADPTNPDAPDNPVGDPPLQPLPEPGTVYFLSSATTLAADTTWLGRGLTLSGAVGFAISGGLNGGAREAVPLQYGPRAQVALGYALARRMGLSTSVGVTDSRFSTGAHATVLTLAEGWNYRWDRRTSLEAGLGVGAARSQGVDGVARMDVIPDATFALGHHIPSRAYDFNGRVAARVSPFVDRLTGRVYPRADLTLGGTWTLGPRVRVSATSGTAFAVGGANGDSLVLGGVGASWTVTRWVSLESDLRTAWSRSPGVETARFQWAASLGIAVRQAGIL